MAWSILTFSQRRIDPATFWSDSLPNEFATIQLEQRSLDALRWGLIPYWAKDPKIGYRTINARMESVETAPSFREAFKRRRCLIPADGFHEWKKVPGDKIPYAVGMKDDSPFLCWVVGSLKLAG